MAGSVTIPAMAPNMAVVALQLESLLKVSVRDHGWRVWFAPSIPGLRANVYLPNP